MQNVSHFHGCTSQLQKYLVIIYQKNYTLRVSMVDFLFLVIATWFNFLSVDEKNLV